MEREWVAEESVVVAAGARQVYDAVANLRRMGEWSPECFAVWVRGREIKQGTSFVGWNRRGLYVWFTNCRVSAAVPGEVFAFRVSSFGVTTALWGYRVEDIGGGSTRLTEYWEDLRRHGGRGVGFITVLARVFTGVTAERRPALNREGMRTTLGRIKAAVEAESKVK